MSAGVYRGDTGLAGGVQVAGQQGVQLQGVELEAGLLDRLRVLGGVLVHGEQHGCLETHQPIGHTLNPLNPLRSIEIIQRTRKRKRTFLGRGSGRGPDQGEEEDQEEEKDQEEDQEEDLTKKRTRKRKKKT